MVEAKKMKSMHMMIVDAKPMKAVKAKKAMTRMKTMKVTGWRANFDANGCIADENNVFRLHM